MTLSTTQQLQRAYQLLREGQRQEAYAILNPLVESDPNNVNAWWLMANTVTNPTHVRWALQQVLALQPDHVQACQMLERLDQQVASTAVHSAGRPQPPAATTAGASMSTGSTTIGKAPLATVDVLRSILAGALVAALSGALWFGADVLLYSLIGERETVSIKVILIPFLLAGVLGGWTAQSVIWGARRFNHGDHQCAAAIGGVVHQRLFPGSPLYDPGDGRIRHEYRQRTAVPSS